MIVSLHVATGAAAGALVRSRAAAIPLGLVLHFLGDVMPHRDMVSRRFEIVSGLAVFALVVARHGPFDRATLGAAAASAPDLEHVLRFIRYRRRKIFPSHRWWRFHNSGGVRGGVQLLAAGILLGLVLGDRR